MPSKSNHKFPDIRLTRKSTGASQETFWRRFGIQQSSGSRYETGDLIPIPTALLMQLYFDGRITDDDLTAAAKALDNSA